ncbi:MAG: 3-phosphoshikimate 1-carboxyvinyltransferase [Clostridia bacterium]|nr:3-phosphoshikimate 1-carboxyvinyltransferase [Clostridia bacterium]
MKLSLSFDAPKGKIKAITSKSVAHRLLICSAFADAPTRILCEETNKDIEATAASLNALGANIQRNAPYYDVIPVSPENITRGATLPCGESGSTLRFLLPIAAALGADCSFLLEGRLADRPLSPLREELESHGVSISGKNPISISGKLCGREFSIDGSVSSQFVSGLLFALTLLENEAILTVTGKIESAPYIDITCYALSLFGAPVQKNENKFTVGARSSLISPSYLEVEGDWSNAAFPLALGVLGGEVEICGLNPDSAQGDKRIIDILLRFGADISVSDNGSYIARRSRLKGIDIDASQIPDLVPVLATVASVAEGKTRIYGASRLRLKESDRLFTVSDMLKRLGAKIEENDDGLTVEGVRALRGGSVSSHNDHRIAMSAAVAAAVCEGAVEIDGAEAVNKSYPTFWDDASSLGAKISGI